MDKDTEQALTVGNLLDGISAIVDFTGFRLGRSAEAKAMAVVGLGGLARLVDALRQHLSLPDTTGDPGERLLVVEQLTRADIAFLNALRYAEGAFASLRAKMAEGEAGNEGQEGEGEAGTDGHDAKR